MESVAAEDGAPIPWVALAGLTGEADGTLYAIEGDYLEARTQIYVIDSQQQPALITGAISITDPNGTLVEGLEAQGIELIPDGFAMVDPDRLHLLSVGGVLETSLDVSGPGDLSGVAYDPLRSGVWSLTGKC